MNLSGKTPDARGRLIILVMVKRRAAVYTFFKKRGRNRINVTKRICRFSTG
jgi:hypothetical protein